MIANDIPQRCDVIKEYTWSVDEIYSDISLWNEDFALLEQREFWLEEKEYQNKMQDPVEVKFILDFLFSFTRTLSKLYVYARLRFDEDLSNSQHNGIHSKACSLYLDFEKAHSWVRPALLRLSDAEFSHLIQDQNLQVYARFLENIARMRQHTLCAKQESLLALVQKPLSGFQTAFTAINNVDFVFPPAEDANGEMHPMSDLAYAHYLGSPDRVLRASAYKSLLGKYEQYQNTIAALLQGQIVSDVCEAKARNYTSSLEASLYPNNIDVQVYDNLVETVGENLDVLHRYISLRKRVLDVENLYFYDLYVPLMQYKGSGWAYERAKKAVVDSVAILGEEYQTTVKKGLYEQNWVDVYTNQKKRSGAYSMISYDSYPYILLNYPCNNNATLDHVFTLAHEVGHSMHTYKSAKNQSYIDFSYPTFVAEVASIFNEQLLLDHLMKNTSDPNEKAQLLMYAIESIRGTLFRQTLFAEFEQKLHSCVEKNIPLTAQLLREEYRKLNAKYYGNDLVVDSLLEVECLRMPHLYCNFYVYQYATGIAAALALSQQVQNDPLAKERYLTFLSSGGSKFPLELLQKAGVDMRQKAPIQQALSHFAHLVEQLEQLLSNASDEPCCIW